MLAPVPSVQTYMDKLHLSSQRPEMAEVAVSKLTSANSLAIQASPCSSAARCHITKKQVAERTLSGTVAIMNSFITGKGQTVKRRIQINNPDSSWSTSPHLNSVQLPLQNHQWRFQTLSYSWKSTSMGDFPPLHLQPVRHDYLSIDLNQYFNT